MLAMVGLVLDGSSTYAQRREQQNVADVAAMAGANEYLLNGSVAGAQAKARSLATANGYQHGVGGVIVDVTVIPGPSGSATVQVDVTKGHRNSFSSVVGMSEWDVSTTATA